MKFPENINIEFHSVLEIYEDIICSITFQTFEKNDFSIGFFNVEKDGRLNIRKKRILPEIKESVDMFNSDYMDSADNFTGTLEITFETNKQLYDRLKRINEFFPKNMNKLVPYFKETTNNKVMSKCSIRVSIEDNIDIKLPRSLFCDITAN